MISTSQQPPKTVRLSESSTVRKFRELVNQFPDNEIYRFSLGKCLYDACNFAEASTHLEQALSRRADWMVACVLLGRCCIALGDLERAQHFFTRSLVLAVSEGHESSRKEIIELMETLG